MQYIIKYFFAIAAFLFFNTLKAQSPVYLHFSKRDGLPSNLIYCALQDREGYMWFGTDKGLARFDGFSFKVYDAQDGLPDPEVLSLYEDHKHRMWISCFHQKPVYRWQGQFYDEKRDSIFSYLKFNAHCFTFQETADSTLCISSGAALLIYPDGSLTQIHEQKEINRIEQIDGDLIGLSGRKIVRIMPDAHSETVLFTHRDGWASSYSVSQNKILYTTPQRSIILSYENKKLTQVHTSPLIFHQTYVDRKGRFWACRPGKGAVCFNNDKGDFSNPVWYLPGKKINHLYEDRQGHFWFMSADDGVFILLNKEALSWRASDGLASSNFSAIAKDNKGHVFAGDDQGNVHIFSKGKLQHSISLGNQDGVNLVRQIIAEDIDRFWVVSDEGYYLFQNNNIKSFVLNKNPMQAPVEHFGAPKAMTFYKGKPWLGSSHALGFADTQTGLIAIHLSGRVTSLCTDYSDVIWKGNTEGLFNSKDHFKFNWGHQFPLLDGRVSAIAAGKNGKIWIASPKNGILEIQSIDGHIKKVESLNKKLHTDFGDVKNIHIGNDHAIWLAGNKGVFRIDKSYQIKQFNTGQGLISDDVKDLCLQGDTLWVATSSGLSLLKMGFNDKALQAQVLLNEFRYQLSDSLCVQDFSGSSNKLMSLNMPYNGSMANVCFSVLPFDPDHQTRLRHTRQEVLLPFPWFTFENIINNLINKSDTIYSADLNLNFGVKIRPGRYLIRSGAIADKNNLTNLQQWELNILPHWSQTIWPWLFLTGLLLSVLGYYYKMRTGFLRLQSTAYQLKLQSLRAQINPHFIGNSINAIQKFFYPPDPEKASEYIHLFTMLLRKTLDFSEKDFIPFCQEIEYVHQYLQMIKLRYAGQFEYQISGVENIDPQLNFPAMLLQPLLENATIHGLAPKGTSILELQFEYQGNKICCTIKDNGVGIHSTLANKMQQVGKRQSKGIEILRQKASVLNKVYSADIEMEWVDIKSQASSLGTGTMVKLTFTPSGIKSKKQNG